MMLESAPVAIDTITIPQKHAMIATNLRNTVSIEYYNIFGLRIISIVVKHM